MRARSKGLGLWVLALAGGAACRLEPLTTVGLGTTDGARDGAAATADGAGDGGPGPAPACGMRVVPDGGGADDGPAPGGGPAVAACTWDQNPYAPVGRACDPAVREHDHCTGADLPCDKTCGPSKSGTEVCTCLLGVDGGTWSCPNCTYDPAPERDYTCYRLPEAVPACPPDPSDESGMLLIKSGATCSTQDFPGCQPCGSHTANAYRDGRNVPHAGFCVCSPGCKWSCASVFEWPKTCLTRR